MFTRSVRDLGAVVSDRRRQLGLTQMQLAERAGVTREWLNRFEKGAPGAALGRVFAVIQASGLGLDVVVDDTEVERGPADDYLDSLLG